MAATHSMGRVDAVRERLWRRIQAASGLVFIAFGMVHVPNQWLALAGPEAYDGFRRPARAVYRNLTKRKTV